MKSINELSLEELKNLVSITTTSGTTYFYCNIEVVAMHEAEAIIVYNGTKYSTDVATGQQIIEGKVRYDAYALSMQQSQAEELLQSKAYEVLKNMFDERVNIASDVIENSVTTVQEAMKNSAKLFSKSTVISDEINTLAANLQAAVNSFDVSKIETALKEKVSEVSSIKSDMKAAIKQVDEVTGELKKLFK